MLGVSPPRPLPADAYDLQTALESVQHLATQTLAGVVQSEATRGLDLDVGSAFQSISPSRGGGILGLATGETREIAAAAGQGESWESAWPPRELTAALGLVTARQMAHAMRCDSEPLIQVGRSVLRYMPEPQFITYGPSRACVLYEGELARLTWTFVLTLGNLTAWRKHNAP